MAFDRRQYAGGAVKTTLTGGTLSSGGTSISMAAATGWPTGAGNFVIVMNRGNATEEKILCASLSGTTLTVAGSGRGYDGTSAAAHLVGEAIELCGSAIDFDEANNAVHQTIGAVAAKGDLLVGSAANTLAKLAIGSTGQVLGVTGGTAAWQAASSGTVSNITSTGGTITVGSGTGPTANVDLANAGPGATGPIGDATHVAAVTINAKGQVTALSSTAITFPSGAMTQLARTVLGSAGTFSFTSISGSYNSLLIKGIVRSSTAAATDTLSLRFNNDSGATYQYQNLSGLVSTAGASLSVGGGAITTANAVLAANSVASYASVVEIWVPEYAATTFFKSCQITVGGATSNAGGQGGVSITGGSWANSAAVTRIDVAAASGATNFVTGSTLTLYGIA